MEKYSTLRSDDAKTLADEKAATAATANRAGIVSRMSTSTKK